MNGEAGTWEGQSGYGGSRLTPRYAVSGDYDVLGLLNLFGGRCEGLARGEHIAPFRRDASQPVHALYSLQKIDAARNRPPAVSSSVHEGDAIEPSLCPAGRHVAGHLAANQLQPQQREPVLHAWQIDKASLPRIPASAAEHAPEAPQAPRIEAGNDDMRLRHKYPGHFAQYLVGICTELERM